MQASIYKPKFNSEAERWSVKLLLEGSNLTLSSTISAACNSLIINKHFFGQRYMEY